MRKLSIFFLTTATLSFMAAPAYGQSFLELLENLADAKNEAINESELGPEVGGDPNWAHSISKFYTDAEKLKQWRTYTSDNPIAWGEIKISTIDENPRFYRLSFTDGRWYSIIGRDLENGFGTVDAREDSNNGNYFRLDMKYLVPFFTETYYQNLLRSAAISKPSVRNLSASSGSVTGSGNAQASAPRSPTGHNSTQIYYTTPIGMYFAGIGESAGLAISSAAQIHGNGTIFGNKLRSSRAAFSACYPNCPSQIEYELGNLLAQKDLHYLRSEAVETNVGSSDVMVRGYTNMMRATRETYDGGIHPDCRLKFDGWLSDFAQNLPPLSSTGNSYSDAIKQAGSLTDENVTMALRRSFNASEPYRQCRDEKEVQFALGLEIP